MESLPAAMPVQEVREMIEELDLVPVSYSAANYPQRLTGDDMLTILEALGYTCRLGEDFVNVETEGGKIQVNFDSLPMISITNGYRFDETSEGVNSIRQAAFEVTSYWDMVKALIDPTEGHLLISLDARHEDISSFQQNIQFYIKQVLGASKDLKERYRDYERERMLKGVITSSTKHILS